MIHTYKLLYPSREIAIADLLDKEIITEDLKWSFPCHAIVDLGRVIIQQATETTPAIYSDEYKFDIMVEGEYDFGDYLILPTTPDHSFSGWITSKNINIEYEN